MHEFKLVWYMLTVIITIQEINAICRKCLRWKKLLANIKFNNSAVKQIYYRINLVLYSGIFYL